MLTLTDDKLLKFVLIWGKVVLCLFGEKSWVVPEPLLSYYSPPAEDLREEWEKYLDEVEREEEAMREENTRNFLRSQQPWIILPPTFPMGPDSRIALFHPDTNTFKIVSGYTDAGYYFQDQNLNWYLSEEKFYDKEWPVLEFIVDSPEDLNPQYWKRYIFIWPIGVMHYNIDAKPPRQPLSKPPSEAVSEVISESPED